MWNTEEHTFTLDSRGKNHHDVAGEENWSKAIAFNTFPDCSVFMAFKEFSICDGFLNQKRSQNNYARGNI